MVPTDLVLRWEVAYRRYREASKASTVAGDRDAAREMALASRELSVVWRQFESYAGLPWWIAAALRAAAEAFDIQAREWNARADQTWPVDNGGSLAPHRRLSIRPEPRPRRSGGER